MSEAFVDLEGEAPVRGFLHLADPRGQRFPCSHARSRRQRQGTTAGRAVRTAGCCRSDNAALRPALSAKTSDWSAVVRPMRSTIRLASAACGQPHARAFWRPSFSWRRLLRRASGPACWSQPNLRWWTAWLLLSYPLHPPGRPQQLRTAHLPELRKPTLFVSGTRDAFGSIDELLAAIKLIPAPTRLLPIEGAGHGLLQKSNRDELPASVAQQFLSFFNIR